MEASPAPGGPPTTLPQPRGLSRLRGAKKLAPLLIVRAWLGFESFVILLFLYAFLSVGAG